MTRKQRKAARLVSASRVVIYARVSTEEQATSGAGIDAQIAECRGYAEREGLTVIDVIVEEPVSGKVHPTRRVGFARALSLLDGCDACGLLVRRTDRISRKTRNFLEIVDAADASGWSIITTDGRLNTATAAGRLHLELMAAVDSYGANVIGERTREALSARKASGVVLGRPAALPAAVVRRIVSERADGRSLAAIADGLSTDGIPAARGGAWSKASVQSVLSSERVAAGRY